MCIQHTRHIDYIATCNRPDGPTGPYMSLILLDENLWEGDHDRLLKAKVDFYIESIKRDTPLLKDFRKEQFKGPTSPMIELVFVHDPGETGAALLDDMSASLKQKKIAHTFCSLAQFTSQKPD